MNKEALQDALNSTELNSKGDHIIANCPFCGKERHLYVNYIKAFRIYNGQYVTSWDCKRCGERGSITKLLNEINAMDVLQTPLLPNKISFAQQTSLEVEDKLFTDVKRLPIGYKRIFQNDYLEQERGWNEKDFHLYEVGKTKLLNKMNGYLIFPIFENAEIKGYVRRSEFNQGIRWVNQKNIEINKLMYGFDEIQFTVKTAIVVEGIFDKRAVDIGLDLRNDLYLKCVSTFGKGVSEYHLKKLKKAGIENLIFILDPDALKEMKAVSFKASKMFKSVLIGFDDDGRDLDEMSQDDLLKIFARLKKPYEFSTAKVKINFRE